MKMIAASLTVLIVLGSGGSARAQSKSNESGAAQVGYGAGSVLTTLVYAPVKASICVVGALSSGLAIPFAGPKKAGAFASSTCSGTWIITPGNLKGQERVQVIQP